MQWLPLDYFPLHYRCEFSDQTGTTGSVYCSGTAADWLGGENVSHRASASDSDPTGDALTCKKSILTKK
jgi:hypothetical protein